MDVAPSLARGFGQLMDKRQNRIADDLGFLLQFVEVDDNGLRGCRNSLRGGLRDDASAGLRPGQRRLGFQISSNKCLIAEHRAHFGGTEHIAKECGIEHSAGQGQPPV
jgi:hypothetical protein